MPNSILRKPPFPGQGPNPALRQPVILQKQPVQSGVRFAPVPNRQVAAKPLPTAQAKLASPTGVKFAPVPNIRKEPMPVSGPSRTAVQRYKVVTAAAQTPTNYGLNYDLRVSDDGKMAVKDTGNATPNGSNQFQELYLAPDVFNASQQALNNANSGITLTQTATTIRGKLPGSLIKKTLHLITIQFADTPNNESYAGCNANAWNVIGTVRNAQPSATVETHGYFNSKINGSRWVASQQDDGAAYKALRTKVTGQTTSLGRQAWQQLSAKSRQTAAKKYGVNQYAKPKAAEAIGIFNAGTQGNTGMGHWAGVLARSGGDYITIENYAGNPGTTFQGGANVNSNWYVRMFGARAGQSFYEFHKTHETADYGTAPIAVRFKSH